MQAHGGAVVAALHSAVIGKPMHQNQSPPSIGVDGGGAGFDPATLIADADSHSLLRTVVADVQRHQTAAGAVMIAVGVLNTVG